MFKIRGRKKIVFGREGNEYGEGRKEERGRSRLG